MKTPQTPSSQHHPVKLLPHVAAGLGVDGIAMLIAAAAGNPPKPQSSQQQQPPKKSRNYPPAGKPR
jgi:hypothetical protein